MDQATLAALPRIDRVIGHEALEQARLRLGAEAVTKLARVAVEEARGAVKRGEPCPSLGAVASRAAALAEARLRGRAQRTVNATGVLLHTNLGRAPLGPRVVQALSASAAGYTSVELDLRSGKRGKRGAFGETALAELAHAEAALVVNNNAAAVMLMLSALALGREVIVSRGELVEIGGGFRVPDVMTRSGARLVEVGTTNKTRVSDYAKALDQHPNAAGILRVHQGNFRQIGFVERPELTALSALAKERGVMLLKDLGGGALFDLSPYGVTGEPVVSACIDAGCDVVCFSTDKVFGGPQGGVLVGRAKLVEAARKDPLARALRLGRLPMVALEATLACYLEGDLHGIPALASLMRPVDEVRARVAGWCETLAQRGIAAQVVAHEAAMGGGTLAECPVASFALALSPSNPDDFVTSLRRASPPVVARLRDDRVLFDGRSVLADEDAWLLDAISSVWGSGENESPST